MLQAFANSFKIPDLRKKILFTFAIIAVYRLGTFIPTPGIDGAKLSLFFENIARTQGGTLFGVMNLFSGGAIHRMTIFALGIMPYISSSIIMQLLTVVIPALEKLAKEGQSGYKKINQYTRYGTIVLSVIQSFFISLWLENPAHFGGLQIVEFSGWPFRLLTVLTLTTGSTFIMWLGEQIQEKGIGNGMSLLITAGILSRMPTAFAQIITLIQPGHSGKAQMDPLTAVFMIVIMIASIVFVVFLTLGERKIPVQYPKRVVGRKVMGGQSVFIPFKVNNGGVMPIIFAQSIILFPATIGVFVPNTFIQQASNALSQGTLGYTILMALLIIFFSYFYTAIAFNPVDVAENMKKYGGFIPGVRPGTPTADYIDFIINRVTLPGGICLAIIAVTPDLVAKWLSVPLQVADFFGGTALLIVVGVSLDTIKQVESQLMMRHYEGFMKHGRLRGRQQRAY
ncbi:MAG: preprotein translocase subunit SecY [Candidatus Omnitrophica bacterium CG1_02_49_16]|nr:MAG: preprotein translocase subunit SecY [Candidatus Omnitrophica bacterium CG1_02_49_16]